MEDISHLSNKIKVYPIVAMSTNGVIGKDNKLPWSCKEDLKRFKEITTDNVVVMGRKTYESIGKPLPNRVNIVVSSSIKQSSECISDNLYIVQTLNDGLLLANTFNKKIFVIGGGTIYKQTLPLWDELYLSIINKHIENGDTYFLNRNDWGQYIDLTHKDEDGYLNFLFAEVADGELMIRIKTDRKLDKYPLLFSQTDFFLAEDKSYSFHSLKLIK